MSDRLLEELTPEEQEAYHNEHEEQLQGAIFHATKDLHVMENTLHTLIGLLSRAL